MLWLSVGLIVGFTSGYLAAPEHVAMAEQNVSTGGAGEVQSVPPRSGAPSPPVVTAPEPEPAATIPADVAAAVPEPDVPPPDLSAYQRSTIKLFPPMDRTRDNGVTFGHMGIGEVGRVLWPNAAGTSGEPTRDHEGMLQTAANMMEWNRLSLSDALKVLAPHITRTVEPVKVRQRWVSTMPSVGDAEPSDGWHECGRHHDKACGDWDGLYAANWVRFRDWAIERVVHGYWEECPGKPRTYGCYKNPRVCFDDPYALRRGLCVLDCGADLRFWARPGQGCELDDQLTTEVRRQAQDWCLLDDNQDRKVCSGDEPWLTAE